MITPKSLADRVAEWFDNYHHEAEVMRPSGLEDEAEAIIAEQQELLEECMLVLGDVWKECSPKIKHTITGASDTADTYTQFGTITAEPNPAWLLLNKLTTALKGE